MDLNFIRAKHFRKSLGANELRIEHCEYLLKVNNKDKRKKSIDKCLYCLYSVFIAAFEHIFAYIEKKKQSYPHGDSLIFRKKYDPKTF